MDLDDPASSICSEPSCPDICSLEQGLDHQCRRGSGNLKPSTNRRRGSSPRTSTSSTGTKSFVARARNNEARSAGETVYAGDQSAPVEVESTCAVPPPLHPSASAAVESDDIEHLCEKEKVTCTHCPCLRPVQGRNQSGGGGCCDIWRAPPRYFAPRMPSPPSRDHSFATLGPARFPLHVKFCPQSLPPWNW